jgi:hypothetical protein
LAGFGPADILLNPIGCNTADVLVIHLGGADSAGFLMIMIGILLGSIGYSGDTAAIFLNPTSWRRYFCRYYSRKIQMARYYLSKTSLAGADPAGIILFGSCCLKVKLQVVLSASFDCWYFCKHCS